MWLYEWTLVTIVLQTYYLIHLYFFVGLTSIWVIYDLVCCLFVCFCMCAFSKASSQLSSRLVPLSWYYYYYGQWNLICLLYIPMCCTKLLIVSSMHLRFKCHIIYIFCSIIPTVQYIGTMICSSQHLQLFAKSYSF